MKSKRLKWTVKSPPTTRVQRYVYDIQSQRDATTHLNYTTLPVSSNLSRQRAPQIKQWQSSFDSYSRSCDFIFIQTRHQAGHSHLHPDRYLVLLYQTNPSPCHVVPYCIRGCVQSVHFCPGWPFV